MNPHDVALSALLSPGARDIRDLAPDVLDDDGHPRIMPASFYEQTTIDERALLGNRYALYCLPTVELCDWLMAHIGQRPAIEIGAGNGRIAARLGIPATDSRLQDSAGIRKAYALMGQPTITYGDNVERAEAMEAIRAYGPDIVLGSWITHRYDSRRHVAGGNMYGPDTDAILAMCAEYVLIGNEVTHADHPLWARPHDVIYPPWLYSRAHNGGRNFIAYWKGAKRC